MTPLERTCQLTTANNSWENLKTLMDAVAGLHPSRVWSDVSFYVPSTATSSVLVALTNSASAPASDGVAVTVEAGKFRGFAGIDCTTVWVKSPDSASTIEFSGTPQ